MKDDAIAAKVPRTCCACGQRILVTRQAFQHHWENNTEYAWHITCPPPWRRPSYERDTRYRHHHD